MVEKFTLLGTSNDGFRHRYSFKKNETFKKSFISFMGDLGFEDKVVRRSFIGIRMEGEEEIEFEMEISQMKDYCEHFKNSKYDVDVFYGHFVVIVLVRTEHREMVVKHLVNEADFVEPVSSQAIVEKGGRKIVVSAKHK